MDVITSLQTDLYYATSGVRVKSNLYSNSEVEAKLKIRGKNLISFSFDLPQEKNEIFSIKSEMLVLQRETEIPQSGIATRRTNSSCTWALMDKALGLQLCSHISVPDVVNSSHNRYIYPSLILSGPTNISVILTKSDPSTKRYVFEYNWSQNDNTTTFWSLLFHTPGSSIERLFVANVTKMPELFNASLAFSGGGFKTLAGCTYNSNPENRRLEIYLDTNGNRSLEMRLELIRSQERTTQVYRPKMLLTVNGSNVTGLIGVIRINEKNGIIQNDFDISFETKRLQALIRGNFIQTEVITFTNVTLNYRFQSNKIEMINFEGKITNAGTKFKTDYRANVKFSTSAYSKLNFVSNATWITVQGHTEGLVTFNNVPDYTNPMHNNIIRVIFDRSYSEDVLMEGSRTRASVELVMPASKINCGLSIKYVTYIFY